MSAENILKSEKVLVTGSASGIGFATTQKFLKEGYEVWGIDKDPTAIDHPLFHMIVCDVRNELPSLPPMDIVINNAGTTVEKDAISVNLEGYIKVAEKYAMSPSVHSLVNVGSISGRTGLDRIRYCSSQGGRIAITKHLAIRLANANKTRVNCVSFGAVHSNLEPLLYQDSEKYRAVADENLLKKWIEPQEAAEWIYFVAVVNKSMTGQDILIDNGEEANYNWIEA